jgi:hypothetical protein
MLQLVGVLIRESNSWRCLARRLRHRRRRRHHYQQQWCHQRAVQRRKGRTVSLTSCLIPRLPTLHQPFRPLRHRLRNYYPSANPAAG